MRWVVSLLSKSRTSEGEGCHRHKLNLSLKSVPVLTQCSWHKTSSSLCAAPHHGLSLGPRLPHLQIHLSAAKQQTILVLKKDQVQGWSSSQLWGRLSATEENHRIVESLRFEKISKIINRQPNTTLPAKPYPEVPHLHIFWTPPGMGTPPLSWEGRLLLLLQVYSWLSSFWRIVLYTAALHPL